MGLGGYREVSDAWALLLLQVSRDLWVPEAEGLCHLVLLEAKVPTGWKYQSQKLLHCPSIWSAIAGLEDLEPQMRDEVWPQPQPLLTTSRIFLLPFSLLLMSFYLLFFSFILLRTRALCPLCNTQSGKTVSLFPFSNFPACPPHPMTHTHSYTHSGPVVLSEDNSMGVQVKA